MLIMMMSKSSFAAGTTVGSVVTMSLSGVMSDVFGWPSVFYTFGKSGRLQYTGPSCSLSDSIWVRVKV